MREAQVSSRGQARMTVLKRGGEELVAYGQARWWNDLVKAPKVHRNGWGEQKGPSLDVLDNRRFPAINKLHWMLCCGLWACEDFDVLFKWRSRSELSLVLRR
jgi:hypothetical protein